MRLYLGDLLWGVSCWYHRDCATGGVEPWRVWIFGRILYITEGCVNFREKRYKGWVRASGLET
jgi:hypothetical protein